MTKRLLDETSLESGEVSGKRARVSIADLLGDEEVQPPSKLSNETTQIKSVEATTVAPTAFTQHQESEDEESRSVYLVMESSCRKDDHKEKVLRICSSLEKANRTVMKAFLDSYSTSTPGSSHSRIRYQQGMLTCSFEPERITESKFWVEEHWLDDEEDGHGSLWDDEKIEEKFEKAFPDEMANEIWAREMSNCYGQW